MVLNEIRLAITDFLNLPIIVNSVISIDVWSLIHLFAGALILFLLIKYIKNKSLNFYFISLFILVVLWEVFEFTNYGILKNSLFLSESVTNIAWDIILGMFGGVLFFKLKK